MYLVDTNIFLEILLKQEKSEYCKSFLYKNIGRIYLTDFTLHSIGVLLFRQDEEELFLKFVSDILTKVQLVSLPKDRYKDVYITKKKINLDFDDSYQYCVCERFGLKLITMDSDFKKVEGKKVEFL